MGMRIRDGTSLLKQVHQHRANIERAATDYAHHADVEYAQPNYLAEIQPAQASSTP